MKKRSVRRTRIGEIPILLHLLDEAYGNPAWHGPSLKAALRGLTARQAAWRPAPGRHNIRELAMHAAYWKWVVRRRLTGEKGGSFPIKGNNWLELPASSEEAWHAEREILEKAHRRLRETVARFSAARLTTVLAGTRRRTALREIAGIALHDVYHTGQIQLLKALRKKQ
ncbi:MAG TPA: DinB family protein [Thermoanaerobaculia bacterium]|nr:DinB family protein [Thermoanaerobaculia bacterium]